jgi:hypothetical protein
LVPADSCSGGVGVIAVGGGAGILVNAWVEDVDKEGVDTGAVVDGGGDVVVVVDTMDSCLIRGRSINVSIG